MRVTSINVGSERTIRQGQREFLSGIDKQPQSGAVRVHELGLVADAIVDAEHHGGPDQAVYVYGAEDYAWWSRQLGRQLRYGTFGENLTIVDFPPDMHASDRLLIGDLILEATAPRIPCRTLAAQMQDGGFGLRFREAERPGVYFRVLNESEIAAGDPVTLIEYPGTSVSMLELFRASYAQHPPVELLRRILAAPVAQRIHNRFLKKFETYHA